MSKHLNNLKFPVPITSFVNMVKIEGNEIYNFAGQENLIIKED